jgi:hypothetical protein
LVKSEFILLKTPFKIAEVILKEVAMAYFKASLPSNVIYTCDISFYTWVSVI